MIASIVNCFNRHAIIIIKQIKNLNKCYGTFRLYNTAEHMGKNT